jgi:uncharacterized protein YcbK (DUF882 family)
MGSRITGARTTVAPRANSAVWLVTARAVLFACVLLTFVALPTAARATSWGGTISIDSTRRDRSYHAVVTFDAATETARATGHYHGYRYDASSDSFVPCDATIDAVGDGQPSLYTFPNARVFLESPTVQSGTTFLLQFDTRRVGSNLIVGGTARGWYTLSISLLTPSDPDCPAANLNDLTLWAEFPDRALRSQRYLVSKEKYVALLSGSESNPLRDPVSPDDTGSFSASWNLKTCSLHNDMTGPGYKELTVRMKIALSALYSRLDKDQACYEFKSGFRSQRDQDRLRREWHRIADRRRGDHRTVMQICKELKNHGYAQCPTGYDPPDRNGVRVARGGPAEKSRHSSGEAADIAVGFPASFTPDISKYRAAAFSAGLCGPPDSDKVHVELPWRKKIGRRFVFGCHFPEGPAPPNTPLGP